MIISNGTKGVEKHKLRRNLYTKIFALEKLISFKKGNAIKRKKTKLKLMFTTVRKNENEAECPNILNYIFVSTKEI